MKLWNDELEAHREEARALLPHLPDLEAEAPTGPASAPRISR